MKWLIPTFIWLVVVFYLVAGIILFIAALTVNFDNARPRDVSHLMASNGLLLMVLGATYLSQILSDR